MIDTRNIKCFDASAIADSGQVFRAEVCADGVHFISGGEYAIVRNNGEIITGNDEYFYNYFDLQTDYHNNGKSIELPQDVKNSCNGIRILNGDIVEIIISFIISANNNIKRIKKTIGKLCENYSEKREFLGISYFAFPELQKLSTITANDFKLMGCGYRAEYLVKTVKELQTADLNEWQKSENAELYRRLIKLCGVGDKVARCIMLFAFHRLDICPVDTWIIKTAGKYLYIKGKTPKKVAVELQKHFGEFGGLAQQYMFYYAQHLKKVI